MTVCLELSSTVLCVCHRKPPKARLAPPKLPEPQVHLIHIAPLPACCVRRICATMRKFGPLKLTVLVIFKAYMNRVFHRHTTNMTLLRHWQIIDYSGWEILGPAILFTYSSSWINLAKIQQLQRLMPAPQPKPRSELYLRSVG